MTRKTTTSICFRVPRKLKELLELIAEYRGLTLSQLFQAYAISLALQFDPRLAKEKEIQRFIEEVFGNEEDSVLQTDND